MRAYGLRWRAIHGKWSQAVSPCCTLRVSWQAHMADPSPAEARASPPDPSGQPTVA